ncbi:MULTISPECIES: lytic transglycosylase domain-containing protein [Acetobacter]|uniref:Lytic transglycosylase domain-containing protein n=1 Tax=Acetobacter sacchari TaxID=2661687 RepID=A0ABS3LVI8_9PROT|nr:MULTISPECIES: lytic transglycosylase domain-containing protein [Acetobacter]MBO1359909.1 lytic transglycosylase domain-containing protein [Acetobacter sacchari]OUJ16843.1 lytic transglycosylase [Acetobacter sp. DsW_063]
MPAPLLACVLAAAIRYDIPPRVFPTIWEVERGANGVVHRNADGSSDLGLMQINTRWVEVISKITHMPAVQTAARLVSDGCFNVAASAVVLRTYLNETHGDLMQAIGDYHSHTQGLNEDYQKKILEQARKLFPTPPSQ